MTISSESFDWQRATYEVDRDGDWHLLVPLTELVDGRPRMLLFAALEMSFADGFRFSIFVDPEPMLDVWVKGRDLFSQSARDVRDLISAAASSTAEWIAADDAFARETVEPWLDLFKRLP